MDISILAGGCVLYLYISVPSIGDAVSLCLLEQKRPADVGPSFSRQEKTPQKQNTTNCGTMCDTAVLVLPTDPPAFEGQQSADGAVDGGVKQDFCPTRDKGCPSERAHHLPNVELPGREGAEERRGRQGCHHHFLVYCLILRTDSLCGWAATPSCGETAAHYIVFDCTVLQGGVPLNLW